MLKDREAWEHYRLLVYVATHTLEWRDENKLTFVWDNQLILMHFERERGNYTLLTEVSATVAQEILYLFGGPVSREGMEEEYPQLTL